VVGSKLPGIQDRDIQHDSNGYVLCWPTLTHPCPPQSGKQEPVEDPGRSHFLTCIFLDTFASSRCKSLLPENCLFTQTKHNFVLFLCFGFRFTGLDFFVISCAKVSTFTPPADDDKAPNRPFLRQTHQIILQRWKHNFSFEPSIYSLVIRSDQLLGIRL
jgi:hypothetical protein